MTFDILTTLQQINTALIAKIIILILIGLYAIFSFMLATKIRSFNKILFLPPDSGGGLIQFIAIFYTLIVVSLFLLALVIV